MKSELPLIPTVLHDAACEGSHAGSTSVKITGLGHRTVPAQDTCRSCAATCYLKMSVFTLDVQAFATTACAPKKEHTV